MLKGQLGLTVELREMTIGKTEWIWSLCHCLRVPVYSSLLSQEMPRMNKTFESSHTQLLIWRVGSSCCACVHKFGLVQPGGAQGLRFIGTRLRYGAEHTLRLPLKCPTYQISGVMATTLCSPRSPLCLKSSQFLCLLISSYHLEDCSLQSLVLQWGRLLSQSTSFRKLSW